jgi:hypothetical protein
MISSGRAAFDAERNWMRSGPQMGPAFSHPSIAPVTRFETDTRPKSIFFSAPPSFCNSTRFFLEGSDRHACSTRTKRSPQFVIESFRPDMGIRSRRSAARSPPPDCRHVASCHPACGQGRALRRSRAVVVPRLGVAAPMSRSMGGEKRLTWARRLRLQTRSAEALRSESRR